MNVHRPERNLKINDYITIVCIQVTLTDTDGRSTVELDLDSSPDIHNPATRKQQLIKNNDRNIISRAKSARPKTSRPRAAIQQQRSRQTDRKPVSAKTILQRRASVAASSAQENLPGTNAAATRLKSALKRRQSLGHLGDYHRRAGNDDSPAIYDHARTFLSYGMKGGRPTPQPAPVRRPAAATKDLSPERPSWGFGQPVAASRAVSRQEDYGALYERGSLGPSRAPSRAALTGGLSYEDILQSSNNNLK
jgi:hypothetical protein